MVTKEKQIGTLLPMSSLVSNTAKDGTFAAGLKFIDWLVKSGQTAWQILPLHQTQLQKGSSSKHVPSPYKGYGVGLDPRFLSADTPKLSDEQLKVFVQDNKYWLENYALFCALRDHFGGDDWSRWPDDIRKRNINAMARWQNRLAPQIAEHRVVQAKLHIEYNLLRDKAQQNGIDLIGDMPFYLCLNSPLVWQYQKLFVLTIDSKLEKVSGVLSGSKSHFGRQVWGLPLYRWQVRRLGSELMELFKIRIKYLSGLFNLIRLDHAKGFFTYGIIDLHDQRKDTTRDGPGSTFFERVLKYARSQNLKIYAEDTGDNLKELRRCLRKHHLPGLKIFRFAYNEKREIFNEQYLRTDKYPKNTVAYTTTHDTEPLLSYLEKLSETEVHELAKRMHLIKFGSLKELAKQIRELVIHSPARIVLIPLQDWLLTTERINIPGTEKERGDKNWQYMMSMPIEELATLDI